VAVVNHQRIAELPVHETLFNPAVVAGVQAQLSGALK